MESPSLEYDKQAADVGFDCSISGCEDTVLYMSEYDRKPKSCMFEVERISRYLCRRHAQGFAKRAGLPMPGADKESAS